MIILIDDDKFIRLGWSLKARKFNIPFIAFKSLRDFLETDTIVHIDSMIFIDSNLEDGLKGEIESEKLFKDGFKNIYLTTGYDDIALNDYPWIKKRISKEFPLQLIDN